jgi:hypothetical protein
MELLKLFLDDNNRAYERYELKLEGDENGLLMRSDAESHRKRRSALMLE